METNDVAPAVSSCMASPIFIGGQHRSGTNLMRRLLHRHPAIACGPESNLLRDNALARIYTCLHGDWAAGLDPRYAFDPLTVDQALAGLINAVFMPYAAARHKRRWAEKTPKNILVIDMLLTLFPHAQFIHLIRDPRDVYCSVRAKAATTTPRWAAITAERSAREWCRRIACGVPWRAHPARYIEISYEALVAQPEATMRRVLQFLGEPWSPSVLDGETIYTTSTGRWSMDLSRAEIAAIEEVAGETMTALGYALSSPREEV